MKEPVTPPATAIVIVIFNVSQIYILPTFVFLSFITSKPSIEEVIKMSEKNGMRT